MGKLYFFFFTVCHKNSFINKFLYLFYKVLQPKDRPTDKRTTRLLELLRAAKNLMCSCLMGALVILWYFEFFFFEPYPTLSVSELGKLVILLQRKLYYVRSDRIAIHILMWTLKKKKGRFMCAAEGNHFSTCMSNLFFNFMLTNNEFTYFASWRTFVF